MIHARGVKQFEVDDDRGMTWLRVDVDDGTIPASITVLVTEDGWFRLTHATDDPVDWLQEQLRAEVAGVVAIDQVAELRQRAPVELAVPDLV